MKPGFKRLIFEFDDERDIIEAPMRGYRSHVAVELEDGSRYPVVFYDPVRLQQTVEDDISMGTPFFAEPGLIILAVVDRANMEVAARALCEQGYFAHLKPLPD